MSSFTVALGIDVGDKRIGIARVHSVARLPEALTIVENNDQAVHIIREIATRELADLIVVGLPRNMNGEKTAQSKVCEDFASLLSAELGLKVILQDETLSSVEAASRLSKGQHLDAEAARVILEDFCREYN
jgi:putative Holliday junction resolvase